jgi:L-alanine-DL-glutamate epimerase-like enolase superfamily enzyme
VKLKFWRADLRLAHTWTIARGSTNTFPVIVVQLTDANGVVGFGEASPVERYKESVDMVETFLRRVDTRKISFEDIPGSMTHLETFGPGNMAARCALNVALLDGAAKLARKPLCNFLGLGFTENRHRTSFSIGIANPDEVRKKVLEAESFPILKLKVGSTGDKANLAALRDVAPKKSIRFDANEAWKTKEQALEMIEWLASDGNVELIEQPMPANTSTKDLAWLKQRSPLPLFADESYHLASDVARCTDCFHGVNVKLVKTGGVSGGLEALRAARKAGLKTMIGCMIETSVLISAAAHLAELCDFLDLDGNLLITNDPFKGVTAEKGALSFASASEQFGLCVRAKKK